MPSLQWIWETCCWTEAATACGSAKTASAMLPLLRRL